MEASSMIELGRQALWLVLVVSAPVVLTALGVGLVVSILQAASQVQEFTLSFVPKILAVLLVLALTAPWMGEQLVNFARAALSGAY
ncbi:MAG TPA: flagellar biosynthesis protein FliQ [Myxococcota bacterium]|nr:flagellar biosynthesis protein FliQ [Myxococcota bacterium]